MAIGTTIYGLNVVTALTAQDEVPLWDAEASGEHTKKITASNLASSVKSLASLPNTTEMNNAIAQSTAKWTLLVSDFNPTEGLEKTVASMSDYDELLICLVSNGWVRQTFTAPLIMIPSAGNSCFPDYYFAGSRLYLSINKTSDTKLTFRNLGTSGGTSNWSNTTLRIYGR